MSHFCLGVVNDVRMRQHRRPPFSEFLQSTLFAYVADVRLRLHCIAHIRTRKLRGKGGRGPVAKALCLSKSVHCDPGGGARALNRPESSCADVRWKADELAKSVSEEGKGRGGIKG